MKTTINLLFFALITVLPSHAQQFTEKEYREDYKQACQLITDKYIYFERKNPLSREKFLKQQKQYADSIKWNNKRFIKEIQSLMGNFPDGHISWNIPRKIAPFKNVYTLGFVPTFTIDSQLVVKKVYPYYNSKVHKNDTILQINGKQSKKFIKELGNKAPKSTPAATHEFAARNFAMIKYYKPLIPIKDEQHLTIKRKNKILKLKMKYKKCSATSKPEEAEKDSSLLLLQHNLYLSLEEIPENILKKQSSLILYELKVKDKHYCVIHPRNFSSWNNKDVDTIMSQVNKINPDALIIDLKDCAGGGFRPALALCYAVGVKQDFSFFYDKIDHNNRRRTGISNFNFITDTMKIENPWKGKLFVRSNEICGSACDFFLRWMSIHERATIIGTPPEGRGGGYDSFKLSNTRTTLAIPLRERIPVNHSKSIEGEIFKPDIITEKKLPDFFISY